jgi:hypothetical protein
VGAPADAEVCVGRGDAEFVEEDAREARVVVLSGVNDEVPLGVCVRDGQLASRLLDALANGGLRMCAASAPAAVAEVAPKSMRRARP